MKTADMIKYMCYRAVELANDKVGQIMIAVPFAVTTMVLSYVDGAKHGDMINFIRIVITLMVIYSLILIKYLKTIMLLKPADRNLEEAEKCYLRCIFRIKLMKNTKNL